MSGMRQGIEARLMLWKATYDGDIGGRLIFEISKEEIEPFFGLPTKKKGQQFAAVLVLIGDDERPIPLPVQEKPEILLDQKVVKAAIEELKQESREKKARPPATEAQRAAMGGLCGLAIKWCEIEHFQEWLAFTYVDDWSLAPGNLSLQGSAAWVVKRLCKVESRKELNTDNAAILRFEALIRHPYMKVRDDDGLPNE